MVNKVELTDTMIRDSFNKTGVDEKYYSIYEAEAKRCYYSLMKDCPDDDDNLESSLSLTDDYIEYYVEEAEKGHCHKWCESVAIDSINSLTADDLYYIYHNAINKMENEEDKERELEIRANSLSEDPIFRGRYKFLFYELLIEPTEKAKEYTAIYHDMINNGKSHNYAHAYADAVNDEYDEILCERFAEAYDIAKEHGMNEEDAYSFESSCKAAYKDDLWLYLKDFIKDNREKWQKEFYLHLICDEIKREEKRELQAAELAEIKTELGL